MSELPKRWCEKVNDDKRNGALRARERGIEARRVSKTPVFNARLCSTPRTKHTAIAFERADAGLCKGQEIRGARRRDVVLPIYVGRDQMRATVYERWTKKRDAFGEGRTVERVAAAVVVVCWID